MTLKALITGCCLSLAFGTISADELADSTRFYGSAPAYAGINIVFKSYDNFIIPSTMPVASMPINDDGTFDFTFPLTRTTYAFADLGRYKASIYLEPGKAYELVFPPFQPKSKVERLNPHFQQEEVQLGIANAESRLLNRNITEFDAELASMLYDHILQLYMETDTAKARELQTTLDQKYHFNHPDFLRHKQLSFLKLWQPALRRQERQVMAKLMDTPVEYQLPVYWDVFSSLFNGFFPNGFPTEVQPRILQAIGQRAAFQQIVDSAMLDTLFTNRALTEIVLMNGLYEAYYNKTLTEPTILHVLDNASSNASSQETREMARQFYNKTALLRSGTEAPDFQLTDTKGKQKKLSDYRGKFVYLNFMHTQNYACQKDLMVLEQYHRLMRKELEIVTVVLDESYESMELFVKNNPYKWDFLHFAAAPQILEVYNIMAVPAYYLIDPLGQLSLSPAPAPEENFRERFADRFMQFQREELRRNPPQERSIFR
jgi:peroxiredoxin